jgi:TRAP-type mannitol/chloroaromatic compound transport system permease large subunit
VRVYRIAVVAFSVTFIVIGFALLGRTAAEGGGVVGFLLGALFIALGTGRLVIERRRHE